MREERVAARLAEPVEVGALARSAAAAYARPDVRFASATAQGCWVVGDERRLRRLVENLLENAARHARAVVRVRVARAAERVELASRTTARACRPTLRERIFERFVRAGDDDVGSGLGLAICRAIARAHGGDVVLEGRNRFVVRLPRLDVSEA